jgi:hypothetical protein
MGLLTCIEAARSAARNHSQSDNSNGSRLDVKLIVISRCVYEVSGTCVLDC